MHREMYDFFNRIEGKHWWFQGRRKIIEALFLRYIGKNPRQKILDVGCGTGMMLNSLKAFGEVSGLDFDEQALNYAKNKVTGISIVLGRLPDGLPQNSQFDVVTVFDVIEHIEDDIGALCEIRKILKPGGFLFCTVPAYQFLWSGHDLINEHKRRYTKKELLEKFRQAGLHPVKVSYYNTFLFLLVFSGKLWSKMRWGRTPKAHAETVPKFFINASLFYIFSSERFLLPWVNLPFGVSLIAMAQKRADESNAA